jgi:predicted adenylyl cyclase CyaB
MRNLEFKARLADPKAAHSKAVLLGFDLYGDLRQTDTYFAVSTGRLMLRETATFGAELIFYQRDEGGDLRPSDFQTARTSDPEALKAILSASLGLRAVVRKRRTLLLLDTVRVHLDNVQDLGTFIEFEVPVNEGEEAAAAERLETLLREFGFTWQDCIRASYADLMSGDHNDATTTP